MIEVCVDSFESAQEAQKAGANRIELCASLLEGGITPSFAMVQSICSKSSIPVHVMIRPRGGDFLYSDAEFDIMKTDIQKFLKLGVAGFVFGILNADGTIDSERNRTLIKLCDSTNITFHRAFDMTSDPFLALEEIIELGVNTILTSGLRQTAEDGFELIKELVKRSGNRIAIMAGSGVNASNIRLLHEAGVRAFHFTARKKCNGKMKYRNDALQSMGAPLLYSEYDSFEFDHEKVHAVINTLKGL